jgi:hypothetical protein
MAPRTKLDRDTDSSSSQTRRGACSDLKRRKRRVHESEFASRFKGESVKPLSETIFRLRFSEEDGCVPLSRLVQRGVRVVTDVEAGCDGHGGARRSEGCVASKRWRLGHAPSSCAYQREGVPAGGSARGTTGCVLGCAGFGGGLTAVCWAADANAIFSLMSSSTACSSVMFWAIWSCLAASCSTLRLMTSRLDARGASCCAGSVAATVDDVSEAGNNQASSGVWAAITSRAAPP